MASRAKPSTKSKSPSKQVGKPAAKAPAKKKAAKEPDQLLHLVFGGELKKLSEQTFKDPSKLDIVGIYPSFGDATNAWRAAAQATVDNAHMRYFVVHIHRLMDPDNL